MYRWNGWYYHPEPPRKARGGIKTQYSRGSFGQSWWARRWISVLENFSMGARLGRGRSYARQGQVTSIDIIKGEVKAEVQGTRPKPYRVTIKVKTLTKAEWKKIGRAISKQAIFAAKLLAGEMPQDIENVFGKTRISLFPEKQKDLSTDCSCPDWANPCKHIAAVHLLLGEEFDRDPFLIFNLRGISREEILNMIGEGETRSVKIRRSKRVKTDEETLAGKEAQAPPPEPLLADSTTFWKGSGLPDDFLAELSTPQVNAAVSKRLGSFPFWRGQEPLQSFLEPLYERASRRGMELLLTGNDPDLFFVAGKKISKDTEQLRNSH